MTFISKTIPYLVLIIGAFFAFPPVSAAQIDTAACLKSQQEPIEQIKICNLLLENIANKKVPSNATQSEAFNTTTPNSREVNSQLADIHLKLMDLYTRQGNFTQASEIEKYIDVAFLDFLHAEQKLKFLRRKGILLYRQGSLPKALHVFQQAVNLARNNGNEILLAKALSDLGTAHLAMTQYPLALQAYRDSLELKEKFASPKSIAVTLNNLGSVFRKLDAWDQAEHYYTRAIAIYHQISDKNSEAHTRENLGLIKINQKEIDKAIQLYQESLAHFKQVNNQHASLRLMILLGNAALIKKDLVSAEKYLTEAELIELKLGTSDQSTALKLNLGKLLSQKGSFQQAEAMLLTGLTFAQNQNDKSNELKILQALVDSSTQYEQWEKALGYQRKFTLSKLSSFQENFDSLLARTRAEFEYDQQQKEIKLLNKENQINQLELTNQKSRTALLSLSLAILIIVTGLFIFWQRHKRQKLKDELEKEIAWHRNQFVKLGVSHNSLTTAFGQLKQAILIINNKQKVVFTNDAAAELFKVPLEKFNEITLSSLITDENEEFWKEWNSETELNHRIFREVKFSLNNAPYEFEMCVTSVNREEPVTILIISDSVSDSEMIPITALIPAAGFHQQLVDLMLSSVEAWEISTRSTRIELAEKSGIWRVSIDDGRLRTRSMDRYMSLKLLPKKPRWREVLRTAHFVLAECELESGTKQSLTKKLNLVSQHIRAEALI
ncbi:tetratricopeptide repeat protein [Aliikangiella coralliicola]|uniref:Tetratricopeptide repeat protein n=1 Tax=Aliikangiella coralliicola TaxID=2592383 RepID=A0A545UAI3_9GAMM|nr:tetratricopeptide repeat protein [Aliikangiella coralliicola]TQV86469.1 tetratricopeptide repeat protein [Aliikangiella coralliicola]